MRGKISCAYKFIITVLVIGAIMFIFDGNHTNDYYGLLLIVAFTMVKGLYDFINHMQEGQKKSAILELLFIVAGLSLLVWVSIQTFNI